jgi:hypothetical protein
MSDYLPGDGRQRIEGDLSEDIERAIGLNSDRPVSKGGSSRVKGARELRSKLRRMPAALKAEVREINEHAAREAHASGLAWMDALGIGNITGQLRKQYRWKVSRNGLSARVGYLTKAARRKVFYAMFLHNGTRHIVARPFHQLAIDESRLKWATNLRSMLSQIVNQRDVGGRRVYRAPRWKRRR